MRLRVKEARAGSSLCVPPPRPRRCPRRYPRRYPRPMSSPIWSPMSYADVFADVLADVLGQDLVAIKLRFFLDFLGGSFRLRFFLGPSGPSARPAPVGPSARPAPAVARRLALGLPVRRANAIAPPVAPKGRAGSWLRPPDARHWSWRSRARQEFGREGPSCAQSARPARRRSSARVLAVAASSNCCCSIARRRDDSSSRSSRSPARPAPRSRVLRPSKAGRFAPVPPAYPGSPAQLRQAVRRCVAGRPGFDTDSHAGPSALRS